jgi:RNA polymerase sigma factor (TIGR02999 family)
VDDLENLIEKAQAGEPGAQDRLFATAYPELRRLAHARLYINGRSTLLDTTSLVHDSYLRLLSSGLPRSSDRRAFFAYAARVMRSVIVDAVRERRALRRGGDLERLTLDTAAADALPAGEDEVLRVHEALQALAAAEPRLAQMVELRYFGGYNELEIAQTLNVTDRTVRRDWERARLLLLALLQD